MLAPSNRLPDETAILLAIEHDWFASEAPLTLLLMQSQWKRHRRKSLFGYLRLPLFSKLCGFDGILTDVFIFQYQSLGVAIGRYGRAGKGRSANDWTTAIGILSCCFVEMKIGIAARGVVEQFVVALLFFAQFYSHNYSMLALTIF